ncbi:MAG: DUF3566 domain-containing protein [Actinomycetes bacterium]
MSQSDQTQPGTVAGQRAAGTAAPSATATAARTQAQPTAETAATAQQPRVAGPGRSPSTSSSTSGHRASERTTQRPTAASSRPGAQQTYGPRRVRLTVSRVDPWSVMKLAFLLSVAIGIAIVVAAGVLWTVLDGMGVFTDVNGVVGQILDDATFDVNDYVGFSKVVSLATVIAVVDVVLLTAIATLGAFLYNLAGALVGGLHVTLTDD